MVSNIKLSLADITGSGYMEKVCRASEALGLDSYENLKKIADTKVEFFPDALREKLDGMIAQVNQVVSEPLSASCSGAGTQSFSDALHKENAPLSGLGFYRIGENGKLAVIGKSEHYQASCGHNFPGYKLLQLAMQVGITNITHNNTRGHITRLLERELVRIANGIAPGDEAAVDKVLQSTEKHVLNRVINMETGSLACEAALKMMLARFYRLQPHFPAPKYSGKTPVFLVMADFQDGKEANYHGTTVIMQMLRGMWHELYNILESSGGIKTVAVRINDKDSFAETVKQYNQGNTRIAGFIHELVLMNYGGIRLENDYVEFCHKLCDENDIPVFVDEIQSCMWSPELFLFKEYKCHPDFVSVGKGFPGGMYPASRMLTTAAMDNLNQFGALVTNGQEELASLANLITIRFAEHNAEHIRGIGRYWQEKLYALAGEFPGQIKKAEGDGLLGTLFFSDAEQTAEFCRRINNSCSIDISAQVYKANCPPAALTKFPLIASEKLLEFAYQSMRKVLRELEDEQ
ncbi:MAG: aminotransferase class III-fold pyridoxal phosphate-dependent enzyme [Lentisphaeria bacterium]|nr:aminotransferase class III-fold pyridoxal phosphate-dependent enzyme [Lentisphaeria bacterium]